ncbi:hypothetical protein TCAL_08467 [Tigriopus californicus]|uniref:GPN-loop GTPase 2 n=1 Tax=Tigriopus californicus TaxID=6832 RepID=A0A553N8K3_TIGCA|nr:GPN-loop GTPase 2-like [Tigriopus californicus]TRY61776.1 hypothetical protein TCAL_08467 [Tigriopus californicus]|eukprot:TCALIF_08467-PA protein Name:"Similar to Gpn2 GPN-loop GTPase 2 (Mus musculus)" AED:0.13 eAED:0.13 QI:0/-1/0/1/-1/1/1/0/333
MSTPVFGQIIIGPPGSGKTTYCHGMAQFLRNLGRAVTIINLDPANDHVPYEAGIDLGDLIQLSEVMDSYQLGPNGGLLYCMEFLDRNLDWLLNRVTKVKDTYLLIDCPGQVELYTHDQSMKSIIGRLEQFGTRLCCVNMVDSHYCSDPSKFISVCLTSLNSMLQIELPHVNVLSKVDLIEKYGRLQFNIDFYTDVLDLEFLLEAMSEDPFVKKYKKMNEALIDLVQNYSLVSFIPLHIDSADRMLTVKNHVDKANGYCFGSQEERNLRMMMSSAYGVADFESAKTADIREKFMDLDLPGETPSTFTTSGPKRQRKEKLGNDLDLIDMEPGFQI